jgi:hypothetical protein
MTICGNVDQTEALCSTRAGGGGLMVGRPFVPTPSGGNGAQGGAKAPPLGGGTGRFFALAKNTGATF